MFSIAGIASSAVSWALGGSKFRLWLVGIGILLLVLLLVIWGMSRSAFNKGRATEKALQQAQALSVMMSRAETDDEVRNLPADQRRSRLRKWASAD